MTRQNPLTRKSIYEKLAKTALTRKSSNLLKSIDSIPDEFVDSPENNLAYEEWRMFVNNAEQTERTRKQFTTLGIVLGVIVVLFISGMIIRKNYDTVKQAVIGTYTPTPTFTCTPLPTNTPTPTFTPTPELPTSTPVPDSAFLVTDLAKIKPEAPVPGQAFWILPGSSAVANPDTTTYGWITEPMPYTNLANTTIDWTMDMPINQAGTFAVFYLDSVTGAKGDFHFVVSDQGQELLPFKGNGDVTLLSAKDQPDDIWTLVGFYQFNYGQLINVEVSTGEGTANYIAMNDVLLVKLTDSDARIIDGLSSGRPMVGFMDEKDITTYKGTAAASGDITWSKSSENWSEVSQEDSYLGTYNQLAAGWSTPIEVRYPVMYVSKPGQYELTVWIPANLAATVSYTVFLDDTELKPDTPRQITQSSYPGQWVSLGIWDIPQAGKITIHLEVAADPTGTGLFGTDAIALLYVGELK